jgi:hypothetical protein
MPQGFIPLSKQMDFLWNEVQGKEKSGFDKFRKAGAASAEEWLSTSPEDYATLWDKYYERSGGAKDAEARNYASSVYAAMADGTSNEALISPNAKFAYGYLTQKGLTPQQAAGITGRLMAESYEDMNPDARNTLAGGKGTYGVAQWRGSRLQDLADFTGVDIGDITSLPATKPGGGLLTSNQGGQTMPDRSKLPYMMGGEQTYNAPNMRQPAAQQAQQGGMRGLLSTISDRAMEVDPSTGMTRLEQFAVALDPLIKSDLRGGSAIEKRGQQRLATDRRNKTVEMLRLRKRDDLADMVERGMISPTDAASQLLATPKEKGRVVDASVLRQMFPGAKIDDGLYNLKPDGTANKIGGGGVSVQNVIGSGEKKFEEKFAELDAKALADVAGVGATASRSLAQIGRLEALLSNIDSGMGASIQQFAGNFGIQTDGLDDIQAASALINALVPAQRPPGSGPMSDADLELFKQSLPRIINSPGGNQIIINTMRGLAEYDAEGGRIVQRLRKKEITQAEAFEQLNSRPDPFAAFKAPTGPAPSGVSEREAARRLLEATK